MKAINCIFFLVLFLSTTMAGCKKDKADAPAPVDGLKTYSGKNRAKVEFTVPAQTQKGKVFFGSGNFEEFTVSDPAAIQSVIVDELGEGEHTLRVVTSNGGGITSDPRAVKAQVYGTIYESGLKPRKWANQIQHSASSIELAFEPALSNEIEVRVVYTNIAGAKDSVKINATENTVRIDNIDTSKANFYYSAYKPDTESIDEFHSFSILLRDALMLNFVKSNWSIAAVSDEETGKEAAMTIDNNASTSWQSKTGAAFPHWMVIDMGTDKYIDGFYYVSSQGNEKAPKNLQFEISSDNIAWKVVLDVDVNDTYLRQRLPLTATTKARYIKITVIDAWAPSATSQFAEIDVYNSQGISGDNGNFTTSPIALVNAKQPFTGDGSNPFPALGEFRMQKLQGWSHSANAVVSYDNSGKSFSLFTAAVWGLPEVTNGKVYQTVNLEAGRYVLKSDVGGADGPVDIYGMVTKGTNIPDYTAVGTDANTIKYVNLIPYQNKAVEFAFTLSEPSAVNIALVYNIRSQYAATGLPWSSFGFKAFELSKIQ